MKKGISVYVTMRKYTEWRQNYLFTTLGGLLGLMIGADHKRIVRIKVSIDKHTLSPRELRKVEKALEDEGFNIIPHRNPNKTVYIKEDVINFNSKPTNSEIKMKSREIKKEYERWLIMEAFSNLNLEHWFRISEE